MATLSAGAQAPGATVARRDCRNELIRVGRLSWTH
jgi:hypothetical protein